MDYMNKLTVLIILLLYTNSLMAISRSVHGQFNPGSSENLKGIKLDQAVSLNESLFFIHNNIIYVKIEF